MQAHGHAELSCERTEHWCLRQIPHIDYQHKNKAAQPLYAPASNHASVERKWQNYLSESWTKTEEDKRLILLIPLTTDSRHEVQSKTHTQAGREECLRGQTRNSTIQETYTLPAEVIYNFYEILQHDILKDYTAAQETPSSLSSLSHITFSGGFEGKHVISIFTEFWNTDSHGLINSQFAMLEVKIHSHMQTELI